MGLPGGFPMNTPQFEPLHARRSLLRVDLLGPEGATHASVGVLKVAAEGIPWWAVGPAGAYFPENSQKHTWPIIIYHAGHRGALYEWTMAKPLTRTASRVIDTQANHEAQRQSGISTLSAAADCISSRPGNGFGCLARSLLHECFKPLKSL